MNPVYGLYRLCAMSARSMRRTAVGGSCIIADNASVHKTKRVRANANAMNMTLTFIPPYAPWFNPVKFAFSVVKNAYRKARVREVGDMSNQIHESISANVTPSKCERFFDHSARLCTEKHRECASS